MKQMFKLFTLMFVLVLTFSLMSCSSTSESTKEIQEQKNEKTVETAKIKTEKQANVEKSLEGTSTKKSGKTTTQASSNTPVVSANKQNTASVAVKKETKTVAKQQEAVVPKKTTPTTATSSTTKSSTTTAPKNNEASSKTVTLSIAGPKDRGTIVSASKVSFKEGYTIFDVLLQAARNHNIQVDYNGNGSTAYVEGIDNIYEFDYGAKSGWLFKLNGVSLSKSIGVVKIKDGDRIECYYTE